MLLSLAMPLCHLPFARPLARPFMVRSPLVRGFTKMTADSRKAVLVPIADDSEEIETACIQDTLVRAGADVTIASVMPGRLQCKMSRGLQIVADVTIDECADRAFDCIALPGGMPGAEHLRDCETLTSMLKSHASSGKLTAAVCASPAVVFESHGLLPDSATCYPAPAFKEKIPGWVESQAVVDGHIVTSQGPGTSLQFALKLVECLYGKEKAEEIAQQMRSELISQAHPDDPEQHHVLLTAVLKADYHTARFLLLAQAHRPHQQLWPAHLLNSVSHVMATPNNREVVPTPALLRSTSRILDLLVAAGCDVHDEAVRQERARDSPHSNLNAGAKPLIHIDPPSQPANATSSISRYAWLCACAALRLQSAVPRGDGRQVGCAHRHLHRARGRHRPRL